MTVTIKNDWYVDFFSGLNCEMWEKAITAEWTEKEVDFLIDVLEIKPDNKILDIPCGFGRHALALAKRGFSLTGVDISADYIQKLNELVKIEKLPVRTILGDILEAEIGDSFDGAYCLGNSFGYVDYDGTTVFVRKVAAALKPGARFVINSGLIAESILPDFPKTGHYVLGDLVMDIRNSYVVDESYMATEIAYIKKDRSETHHFKHYVYTLSEVKRLLSRHGLRTIAAYSSTDKETYQLGDRQIYLVAEKRYD